MRIFAIIIALMSTSVMATTTIRTINYGNWKFVHSNQQSQVLSPSNVQISADALPSTTTPGVVGVDAIGVPTGNLPTGANAMSISFTLVSQGFFSGELAHLEFGVGANWHKGNSWIPEDGLEEGRGIEVGYDYGTQGGCSSSNSPAAQVESTRGSANPDVVLYPATCSPKLQDNVAYVITISADTSGNVSYLLKQGATILANYAVLDATSSIPTGLGGWYAFHIGTDTNPTFANSIWTVQLNNVVVTYYHT
ncbi:MAG: hypothetical protein ACREPN_09155 [Rudaea sp.]